jgi:hypothetical protein
MDAALMHTYNGRLASMLSESGFIALDDLIHNLNLTKYQKY